MKTTTRSLSSASGWSKQADAILGMELHSNYFTEEGTKAQLRFLSGGDAASLVPFHLYLQDSGMPDRVWRRKRAYTYFAQSARMDLDDYHDNFMRESMRPIWRVLLAGGSLRFRFGLRVNPGDS